jgi:hypothetical protein
VFVQVTTSSRKGGNSYVSYLVRQSFRTPAGPRSRTVCNITDLPQDTRDLIAASLKGQQFVATSELQLHEALDYGGLAVLNDAWSRFHLDELLADLGSPRQRGLLKAVIYSRLLFPCAKLSLAHQAQGTWLAAACGLDPRESFDEDDLYEAMDLLNGQDGWYLLHTNEPAEKCSGEQVLGHYKGLLDVEEAFCELKSYLEVRPVHHRRPDRVINHVRLCFLAYWLSARLGGEWRGKGETEEVPRVLRHLQTIRLGVMKLGQHVHHVVMTDIPKNLNDQLVKLGLVPLFSAPPSR